jgi:hypothetical protein
MFCTKCGQPLAPNATACLSCGQRVHRPTAPPHVPNYLFHSIFATLCCCLPVGIVGVIYAAQVDSKLAAGDVAGAMAASKNAKLWSIIALALGLLIVILNLAFGVLGAFLDN